MTIKTQCFFALSDGQARCVGHQGLSARQRGVGLIEILVAVVILAIGFLASAGMQVTSMRFSQSAYFDSQAYFMAGDMIARMRANLAGVKTGAYDSLGTAEEVQNPGCTTKMCTPAEIALQDRYDWSLNLYGPGDDDTFVPLLPSNSMVTAAGAVSKLDNGGYSVTITWADEAANANGQGLLRVDLFTEN